MHEIMIIWLKELRDTIRDRRTLIVMVLIPVLVTPALIVGLGSLARSSASSALHIAVAGGSAAPAVVGLLRAQPHIVVTDEADGPAVTAAVKGGKADAGLVIPPDFAARIAAGRSARAMVVSDSTQTQSARAAEAITLALGGYRTAVVTRRLQARGIDPGLLEPVATDARDVATKQALAGFLLSLIVPTFLVIYSLVGGMYTAMDLSAGEKERFTLEALLLSPATKLQITLGKLLAVSTVAVCTIALALTALFVALRQAPLSGSNDSVSLSLPAGTIVLIALLGALLAISFSALELALGVFARSFKEAQNYITPLYLLAVLPVVALSSVPGFKPGTGFFAVPALNTVLVFKEALVGAPAPLHVGLTVATMLVFCVLCVAVTLRIFGDERVLLRS